MSLSQPSRTILVEPLRAVDKAPPQPRREIEPLPPQKVEAPAKA